MLHRHVAYYLMIDYIINNWHEEMFDDINDVWKLLAVKIAVWHMSEKNEV